MATEIIRCDEGHVRELARAYNEAIRDVPHCYPVAMGEFRAALAPAIGGDPAPPRSAESVLAARDAGTLVGFAHLAVAKPGSISDDEAGPETGLLRFFWYHPGQRRAGEALLEAVEAYYREQGMSRAEAFSFRHNYPFYHLPPARLSDRLGHVAALLGLRG